MSAASIYSGGADTVRQFVFITMAITHEPPGRLYQQS